MGQSLVRLGDNAIYTDREGVRHMVTIEEGLALYYAPEEPVAPPAPVPAPASVTMDDDEDNDWEIEAMARDHWNRSHL